MITRLLQPRQVKGCTNIVLYRDNEDPFTFYYMNNRPRICVDKGKPVFDYMVIGRAFEREGAQGVQEGRLVMSISLAPTSEEMKKIEQTVNDYIRGLEFENEAGIYYKKFTNLGNRWSRKAKICPVGYTSGKVLVNITGSNSNYTYETKPSCFGDCRATIAANFDTQQSQILYQIFKPSKDAKDVNLAAGVEYQMTYKTILPFRASVEVDYKRVYNEFQEFTRNHYGIDSSCIGGYTLPSGMRVYLWGADLYVSKEDLQNHLRNSDKTNKTITVTIQDYDSSSGSNNEQYEQLILSALQSQLAENICDKLFEKVDPVCPKDAEVSYYDVNTTGSKSSEKVETKRNVVYDVSYKLRSNVDTTVLNNFKMSINKDKVVEVEANASENLSLLLDEKCNINSLVRELDASDIRFQKMSIPIRVDGDNFGRDIALVSVRVIYKGKSNNVKMDKVFDFDGENPETKIFEVVMDRDENDRLINEFEYQTRIRYRNFDVYGKNVRDEDKWTAKKKVFGEGIYVPYSGMRNLCVNCEAGDVAWDVVQKMIVELIYKSAPEKNGAQKLMVLTESNPSDTWNCYMYNEDDDAFVYRIHYFYQDGTEDWSQEFEGSGKQSDKKLYINDKLSGVFRAKFELNFKKSIEKVRIIVKCQGKEEDSGWIYQPDTWTWESRLKEDGDKNYSYKYQYYLVNGDDSLKSSDWSKPQSMEGVNQQTIPIDIKVNQISLIIDGESIDWNKWSRVYLHFVYDDDVNNLHYGDEKIPPIKLSPSKNEATVVIPVVDDSIRPEIFAEYIPQVGEDVVLSEKKTAGKIVILPNAAPPIDDRPASTPVSDSAGSTATPVTPVEENAPETKTAPVVEDLSLTFSVKSMDWDKWYLVYIHVKYDDDANDIHINDKNLPKIKMKAGSDDATITFQIKNPDIRPRITVDYVTLSGDSITTDPMPVTGSIVNLPDAIPPKE